MVNQQIIDWIKIQEAYGYSPQRIYSYLIQHGYNPSEVNEALDIVTQSSSPVNQQIQSIKPPVNILPILIISFVVIAVVIVGIFYFMPQNNKEHAKNTTTETVKDLTQSQQPNAVLDLNCDALPDKIDSCAKYKYQFTHPFTGEPMTKEILGIADGKCNHIEQMPNNGKLECKYTESMRKAVAKYYRDVAAAGSVGINVSVDIGSGETTTKYTIDGKEVSNPLDEAMSNGQCVISGY